MHRLRGADAGFLYAENPTMPVDATILVEFAAPDPGAGPLTVEGLRRHLAGRLDEIPSYRWRLRRVPLGLHHAMVVDDPDFDLDYHLRSATVEAPGDAAAVDRLIGVLAPRRFDRRHPLWMATLIDGLQGGRQGLLLQFQHVFFDGTAIGTILSRLLGDAPGDPRADAAPYRPEWPSALRLILGALQDLGPTFRRIPALFSASRRGQQAAKAQAGQETLPAPKVQDVPRTILNDAFSLDRVFTRVTVSMEDVGLVRRAASATVNQVVLASVAGALRAYLESRSALPDRSLIADVPISTRPEELPPSVGGNWVSHFKTTLATDQEDPWKRLQIICTGSREARERIVLEGAGLPAEWLDLGLPFIAEPVMRIWSRRRRKHRDTVEFNALISNVRAPAAPLGIGPSRVDAIAMSGPPLDGAGLNITVATFGDDLCFAIQANPTAVDDAIELAGGIRDALAELVALAADHH